MLGLSLAVINAVFPPGRRATMIALYFGVGFAIATPLPALGSMRTVLVGGLGVMLAGLLLLRTFDENNLLAVVFVALVLDVVGGAFVGTPQATIMMASAPDT